jgi:hypothetical protein
MEHMWVLSKDDMIHKGIRCPVYMEHHMEALRNTAITSGRYEIITLCEQSEEWTLEIFAQDPTICSAFVRTYNNESQSLWRRIPIDLDPTTYNARIKKINVAILIGCTPIIIMFTVLFVYVSLSIGG